MKNLGRPEKDGSFVLVFRTAASILPNLKGSSIISEREFVMKNLWIAAGVFAVAVVVVVLAVISVRNGLIQRDEDVKAQWSQVETQLQRRSDLIPNLVNTVKGYAKHEEKIFAEIADARSRLLAAGTPEAAGQADAALKSALGRLLAVAEAYPNLKANENFARLQDELAGTENRIAVARTRYNDTVRDFNAAIRKFPGSMFASGLNLKRAEFFEAPAGRAAVEKVPQVNF